MCILPESLILFIDHISMKICVLKYLLNIKNLDSLLICQQQVNLRLESQVVFFFICIIQYRSFFRDNNLLPKHTPDWKGGFWLTAGDS
jgi:hypothetical protein